MYLNLYRKDEYYDPKVERNLAKLSGDKIDPVRQVKFRAAFYRSLPFLNRLEEPYLEELISKNEIQVITLKHA
jgi:hypothetical protein